MPEPRDPVAHRLRCSWFSSVQELADLDLQRCTWLDLTNRNPHWSFIEFVCSYPEKDQLVDAQLKGLLTAAEFDALNVLRDAIEGYSAPGEDDFDNAAVLNDPAWFSVVQIAKRVQQQLLAVVVDEGEMAALREALSPDLSP